MVWFQGDHNSGYTEFRSVLWMLHSFLQNYHSISTKSVLLFNKSQIFIVSLRVSSLLHCFLTLFAFGEADLHTIQGRETLSRPHNDLNTTDDNMGPRPPPHQLSYVLRELEF